MIRQGWVIIAKEKEYSLLENIIYMSKKAAEEAKQKYEGLLIELYIERYKVIEDDQSIDNFYNQIEQEDPAYQAALTEAINEVKQEIENTISSNNSSIDSTGKVTKKYLKDIFDEAADKNWLSTISICGGDY